MKYTVEYYRKDGVSEKAFVDWFTNQFLPRAVPIMRKHNILQYAIEKPDVRVGAAFQAEVQGGGWKVNNCDFVMEYWVKDEKDMRNLAMDPEWALDEDTNNWLDMSKSTVRISNDTTTCLLEHGATINGIGQRRRGRATASFD